MLSVVREAPPNEALPQTRPAITSIGTVPATERRCPAEHRSAGVA
jgi:hypothetical protein